MPDYDDQKPFIDAEFEDLVTNTALIRVPDPTLFHNVEPRCPCILLLDTSGSMYGQSIDELNTAIKGFKDNLMADDLTRKRVEVAIITFGEDVRVSTEFQTADNFQPPTFMPNGATPMGEAIEKAIQLLTIRKAQIRSQGIQLYRPWIVLVTDGAPTDSWRNAAELVRKGEKSKHFVFFPIGVTGYNKEILAEISIREPVRLASATNFKDFFKWLSDSLSDVSKSQPGDEIKLASPLAPSWAVID